MNIKLMKYLCGLSQPTLKKVLNDFLIQRGYHTINASKFIYAEGDLPICLVAHLDTVFKTSPTEIYYDQEHKVLWSPQGLGADDRAGVYAILSLVNSGLRPSVVFCTDEEKGGIGAQNLVRFFADCPTDLKMIIEFDRQGKNDCVFYDCDNPSFENFIQQYGFELNYGTFSDISFIAPEWGVAAVNLSVGYVKEHTTSELLHTDWLEATINKVRVLLKEINTAPHFAYIPYQARCVFCSMPLTDKENTFVTLDANSYGMLCNNCATKYQDILKF